jgi:hypothetical protein
MTIDLTSINGPRHSKAANFEELITQLLLREHGRARVHAVAGQGGDEGIDVFVGDSIDSEIDLYQCKYFVNAIGRSQKRQIASSLETVADKSNIKSYTLCIPRNLTPSELRWVQDLTDKHRKVELWDGSKIESLVMKYPDVQRTFFPETFGRLVRYFRSPSEPEFELARAAITPQSYYPTALRWLRAKQCLVISGPPHVGKTTLARKMAIEIVGHDPTLSIIDIEQSAFDVLQASSPRNFVILLHDPFGDSEPPGAKWPFFQELTKHNHVIVTCRNNELVSSNYRHRLNEAPFYDNVKIISGDAYSVREMQQIFRLYLGKAPPPLAALLSEAMANDRFARLAAQKLNSPHAIAYFFDSLLVRHTPADLDELCKIAAEFQSIEEAVKTLYQTSPQIQRLFLLLVAALGGQYEERMVNLIFDRCLQTLPVSSGLGALSFDDCMRLFRDIVGPVTVSQARYRGFKDDPGLSFLHPSYRETILHCGLNSPIDRKLLYEGAKDLILRQEEGNDKYDLVSAGFELINDNWPHFERMLRLEPSRWVPYSGEFADHVQAAYFLQLGRLADIIPDQVLKEGSILLRDNLVGRSRGFLIEATFLAALIKPLEGLAILKASGELKDTKQSAWGFAKLLERHGDRAREYLASVMKNDATKAQELLISSLKYLSDTTFQELGIRYLEEILDESWDLKTRFMYLWTVPAQMQDGRRLQPHLEALFEAWRDSDDPRKYGFLVTLWANNKMFMQLPDEIWVPLLKLLLNREIDTDSELSLLELAGDYLREVSRNSLRDDLLVLVQQWIANLSKDPEAAGFWQKVLRT